MVDTMASWLAIRWFFVTMLMSIPRERAPTRNTIDMPKSSQRLPRRGIWKKNSPTSTERTRSMMPMVK